LKNELILYLNSIIMNLGKLPFSAELKISLKQYRLFRDIDKEDALRKSGVDPDKIYLKMFPITKKHRSVFYTYTTGMLKRIVENSGDFILTIDEIEDDIKKQNLNFFEEIQDIASSKINQIKMKNRVLHSLLKCTDA